MLREARCAGSDTKFLSSLCFALAELRKEGGGGDWERGRRGFGGSVAGAGEEEGGEESLEGEFNLHMVFWPIHKGQELRQFRLYSQTNHALLGETFLGRFFLFHTIWQSLKHILVFFGMF